MKVAVNWDGAPPEREEPLHVREISIKLRVATVTYQSGRVSPLAAALSL